MRILFIAILFSNALLAMPEKFEVWFLSPDDRQAALWMNHLVKPFRFSKSFAFNNLQCQQMGEYCFDPQVGLYKLDDKKALQEAADYSAVDKLEDHSQERLALGTERKTAECDGDSFFDVFCGEGVAQKKESAKFELWIDTSSTMKQVDFPGYDKMCERESFLKRLNQSCSFNGEMKVSMFNEVKKQLDVMDRVCLNSGLNNRDRIISDIKISKAKHLVVITDIFEADTEFITFVENSGGIIKGLEKPMYAADLKSEVPKLQKKCL